MKTASLALLKNEKGEDVDVVEDNIINNPNPAWTIAPKKLKNEDGRMMISSMTAENTPETKFEIPQKEEI